jgi:hypothetical protein
VGRGGDNFDSHKHITLAFYLTADQIKQIRALVFNTPVSSPLFPLHFILIYSPFAPFHLREVNSSRKSSAKPLGL